MTDTELEQAATYVLSHSTDLDAQQIVGRLDKMDQETRICRGQK